MCGIGGIIDRSTADPTSVRTRCEQMATAMVHRGPDDFGAFYDLDNGVGLVHRRLSIIDLSEAGHQPMATTDGRYTIVFNGEIYNYESLREDLKAQSECFAGHSDTEVLLRLYQREGIDCLDRIEGMFAFAVWDQVSKSLTLARGPFGIKPLYYWQQGETFAFASEVRALLEADIGPRELSTEGALGYFMHGSLQERETLIRGVRMLPAGSWLEWKGGEVQVRNDWTPTFPTERIVDRGQAIRLTSDALEESVERHFVSDVPVGIFLSGGLDSTALLALAKRLGKREIHTFNISFDESDYNEGEIAARTAAHFSAVHHEWRLTSGEAKALLGEFKDSIDQPSVDGFNTFCVSRFASHCGLKVVLSGLGGDEVFGSYPSFNLVPRMQALHRRFGMPFVRSLLGSAFRIAPAYTSLARFGRFLKTEGSGLDAYQALRSIYSEHDATELVRRYAEEIPCDVSSPGLGSNLADKLGSADQVTYFEITRYMLNQLLRDSDVMSMAHGLELRVPFVDRQLFQTLAAISPEIRISANKDLLVEAVPEIPDWVRNQPNRGFSFPFPKWVGESWKTDFEGILLGLPEGSSKWYHVWAIFVFEEFLERNKVAVLSNPL
ncbi:MAG: asparagine synthase (glutamine-hydrolyzing) [Planctomycetes bacterium]|nr:asparagine synthase (glutamine-hydrolyzing) [Planctomycetota bacterium]